MKKTVKNKQPHFTESDSASRGKQVELVEVNYNSSKLVKPALSFTASFFIIAGFVLGIYWYGRQVYQTVQTVFRASPIVHLPSRVMSQYYDPLDLIQEVKKQKSAMVFLDVRSTEEYKKEHIKGALSFPIYTIKNEKLEYISIEKIPLNGIDRSKNLVVYGPSTSFQRQQGVVDQLKKIGYSAQLLAVGWNELRHFQNIWIPEGIWGKIDVGSIIESE